MCIRVYIEVHICLTPTEPSMRFGRLGLRPPCLICDGHDVGRARRLSRIDDLDTTVDDFQSRLRVIELGQVEPSCAFACSLRIDREIAILRNAFASESNHLRIPPDLRLGDLTMYPGT